ncbi:MAG: serine/threonine-protein kinase, partial [Myxococcota bacterium]
MQSTERFNIERQLGAGGMGEVYLAHDRERNMPVALKTMRRMGADALLRFKREFRALADISHQNLVSLYELVAVGEQWFLTMEPIDGVDLLSYVRGGAGARELAGDGNGAQPGLATSTLNVGLPCDDDTEVDAVAAGQGGNGVRPGPAEAAEPYRLDLGRLHEVLLQLVSGLRALHRHGCWHLDIKPSNVLVTRSGRVVILDFGLVAQQAWGRVDVDGAAGTPAYMAPELVAEGMNAAGAACDWYGVGVMLYEALTGQRPYGGDKRSLIAAKLTMEPPAPRSVRPGVPADLSALCAGLLRRDPARRATGLAIVERVQARAEPPASGVAPATAEPDPLLSRPELFVGRDSQLAELDRAFAAAVAGRGQIVLVRGRSGMGKSALLDHFCGRIVGDGAVVLSGRCYERESVPYKALDSLVDALASHLATLPAHQADVLMPRAVRHLAQL